MDQLRQDQLANPSPAPRQPLEITDGTAHIADRNNRLLAGRAALLFSGKAVPAPPHQALPAISASRVVDLKNMSIRPTPTAP